MGGHDPAEQARIAAGGEDSDRAEVVGTVTDHGRLEVEDAAQRPVARRHDEMLAHDLRVQQRAVRLAGQRNRVQELRDLLEPHLGEFYLALPRHCRRALSGEERGPVSGPINSASGSGSRACSAARSPPTSAAMRSWAPGGICVHILARSSPGSCSQRLGDLAAGLDPAGEAEAVRLLGGATRR
jgi:hypothetical protein